MIFIEYDQLWLVSFQAYKVNNWNLDPRNKLHAIHYFPAGSLPVNFLGIICGRESFAVLYNSIFNSATIWLP